MTRTGRMSANDPKRTLVSSSGDALANRLSWLPGYASLYCYWLTMSDWLLNLPVVWMAVIIFAGAYLLAAGEISVGPELLKQIVATHPPDP